MKRLITFKEFCNLGGFSERHGQRLRARGEGPPVIQIGDRQFRIDEDGGKAWLHARRKVPPGFKDAEGAEKATA